MNKQITRTDGIKQCLNCGAALDSHFCAECGQKNKDYRLTFKDLFSDFLEELLDVDSRVLRSLRMLYTKPGLLTSEYVKGRRVSYLPPVRLYLVASVLFFLAISLNTMIPSFQNNQFFKELTETGDLDDALEHVVESQAQSLASDTLLAETSEFMEVASDSSGSAMSINIGSNTFDSEQSDFLASFSDNFAKMMFLLLPVAALQLKALYWRRKKLYIEHFIFSLHVHAFIFSLLILTVMFDYKIIMWLVLLGSLAYLYMAMKNFYLQSYFKTFSKMLLLLFSYALALGLLMTLTMVATAIGLVLSGAG